jgi:hypothetical protein
MTVLLRSDPYRLKRDAEVMDLVADGYDAVSAAWPTSPTLQCIWGREARGSDHPTGFEHISFLTLYELRRVASELHLSPRWTSSGPASRPRRRSKELNDDDSLGI